MIKINKDGVLQIKTKIDSHYGEQYVSRTKALINLLKNQGEDVTFNEDTHIILEMLEELTPSVEQANKMFKKPDQK